MKRAFAVLLLIGMTANCAARGPALAGPTGSGAATSGPQGGTAPDVWRQYAQQLPAGSVVRIRTASGERLTGTLLAVGNESVTVSPRTRVPEPTREIRFDTIVQMDLTTQQGASLAKAAAVGAGVGAGVFFGLLLALAAAWDD